MRALARMSAIILATTLGAACSSGDPDATEAAPQETAGAGGGTTTTGAGGAAVNAGAAATGGIANTGGAKGSGGTKGSGGSQSTGGATSSGGATGSGGTVETGGWIACNGGPAPTPGPSTETPGTWADTTPQSLAGAYVNTILADPARPSDLYINVDHQGTWKSGDYGATWTKVSVGAMATGTGAWSAAIDLNPCRDPATPPVMYIPQGYGALGIWKSTDGGVNWTNVWNNNIFAEGGTTNISSDVGSDIAQLQMVDPADNKHLITCLHGYGGSGGNNGVFETTDGGQTWIVHKATTFTFQPHNSLLHALDAKTWLVTPGTVSSTMKMYRTTDGGANWADLGDAPQRGMGHILARAGFTLYTGADYNSGVAKSLDMGLTWKKVANTGGQVSWVVTTATKVYASDAYQGTPTIRHADLTSDAVWTSETPPSSMNGNGSFAVVTFDGAHHIIVAAQHTAGVWRYVEP